MTTSKLEPEDSLASLALCGVSWVAFSMTLLLVALAQEIGPVIWAVWFSALLPGASGGGAARAEAGGLRAGHGLGEAHARGAAQRCAVRVDAEAQMVLGYFLLAATWWDKRWHDRRPVWIFMAIQRCSGAPSPRQRVFASRYGGV